LNPTDAVVTSSKAVIVMDHIKNNRIEYLGLLILSHLLGWLDIATSHVQGVCA
jgi:hypothetical protein